MLHRIAFPVVSEWYQYRAHDVGHCLPRQAGKNQLKEISRFNEQNGVTDVPLAFRVPHNSWAYLPRNTLVLGKQQGQHGGDLFILRRVSTLETLH